MVSDEITLRDTFAAAAMAVLDEIDRALRERARNGAPDAREQANTNSADFSNTLRNGAPSARETVPPVLWAVRFDGEPFLPMLTFATTGEAEAYQRCTYAPSRVVRLYDDPPPPALTDAEREAIAYYIGTGGPDRVDATLRALLARLGGER